MRHTIDGRELIVMDILDTAVRGTYHKPCDSNSNASWNSATRNRIGVLFLNGMYVTRAANGDAAVYWANSLAECGYPSFRVDLPGLGDSEGDSHEDWLGFVNSGGYAPFVIASIKELVGRLDLSGMVLVGHCSGAVSALYAAVAARVDCKGLVLMDPYFHLPHAPTSGVRHKLNIWALRGRLGRALSRAFDFAKQFRLLLRGSALPANANVPLIRACKELASSGLPILVIKAPNRRATGTKVRTGEFDYFKYVFEVAGQHRITMKLIDGANHSFSNHRDRAVIRENIERWLTSNFPSDQFETNRVSVSPLASSATRSELTAESVAS